MLIQYQTRIETDAGIRQNAMIHKSRIGAEPVKWALAALSAVPILLFAGGETVERPLAGFEDVEAVSLWQPSGPTVRFTLNHDIRYINSGSGSAKLETPSTTGGGPRWPSVTLPGIRLDFRDWSAFDELICEVFNPSDRENTLYWIIKAEGGASSTTSFSVRPGRQTLRWKIPEVIKQYPVEAFQFFRNDPPEAMTIYLDDLRLSVKRDWLTEKIAVLRQEIGDAELLGLCENHRLAERLKKLSLDVAELSSSGNSAALMENARRTVELRKKLRSLCRELNAAENQAVATRFHRQFGERWGYGWIGGTTHVFRDELPFTGILGGTPELSLARRESEGFQLVLRSPRPVDGVRLAVGPLLNHRTGELLPPEAVEILPVGYVRPEATSYPTEPVTLRPDPLLNYLKSFHLDAEVWQPVWFDITTSANTAPGIYEGIITVEGENIETLRIPLRIRVWDFELPLRPTLPNAFTYEANEKHRIYGADDAVWREFCKGGKILEKLSPGARRLRQLELTTEDMLLAHHITPSSLYLSRRPHRVADVERWISKGGSCYNLFYIQSIPSLKVGEPYPAHLKEWLLSVIDGAVEEFRAAGVLQYAYIYAFDEIGENQFAAARDILSEIKRRYPEIPVVTTAFDPSFGEKSGLKGLIDVWVPLAPKFETEAEAIRRVQTTGGKVWYYTCMYTPEANFLLEQPAVAPRLLTGIMQYKYGSDGFLYYQTTYWNMSPLLRDGPITGHTGRSAYLDFNGDGMLLYPGENGPVPSIRLKAIRDGFDDYEYLIQVRAVAENPVQSEEVRQQARQLLEIPDELVHSMRDYDRSGRKLQEYRSRLGDFLDRHSHAMQE